MPADPHPALHEHAATSPTPGPPPAPPAPPPPPPRSGLAVASLWLGIGALLLVVVPLLRFLGLVAAVVGLTLGVVALVGAGRARAGGRDETCGRGRAGVALSGVALLLGLVATVSSVVAGVQDGMARLDAPAAGDGDPAGPWPPSSPPPGPSSPGADPFAPALLPVGSAGAVGDYEATVTAFTPRTSTLHDPGTGSSQTYSYVQVDLVLTNRGSDVAAPLDELQQVLVTADDQYGGTECSRVLDVTDAPVDELQPGQTATLTVCVDVPVDAAVPERYALLGPGDEQDVLEGRFAHWAVPPPPG